MKAKPLFFTVGAVALVAILFLLFGLGEGSQDPQSGPEGPVVQQPVVETKTSPEDVAPVEAPSQERESISIPSAAPSSGSLAIGAGVIRGRLVEAAGQPAPDFLVEAYGGNARIAFPTVENWFEEKSFELDWKVAGTKTDGEGRFELRGLPSRAM